MFCYSHLNYKRFAKLIKLEQRVIFNNPPKIAFVLPLVVISVAALIALNEIGYRRSIVAAENMVLEQEKRTTIHTLMEHVLDAETGQRGYLLTGDEKYLLPYSQASTNIGVTLDRLRTIYLAHPEQLDQFADLSRAVSRKLAEIEVTVKLRSVGGDSKNWMQVISTDIGREYMAAVREKGAGLIAAAVVDMEATQAQIDRSLTVSRIGVTLAALLFLLAFVFYLRQTAKLDAAAETQRKALAEERIGLERLVRERTTRLTVLANHLQKVQEAEREHLAREMHDELGALLTAAKLDVARIRAKLADDNGPLLQRLTHLTETLNSVIALKRKIVEDLRPSSLSNLGLVAALDILCREFGTHTGLVISTTLDSVELDDDAELTLYRVVQESLTNISKYARAQEVSVVLQSYNYHVELDVVDNGVGFDLRTRLHASHGFSGMRHRIEALDGRLEVTSAPGQGTRIRAVIPKRLALSEGAAINPPNQEILPVAG
jgi:signal transduction histidine kinase